MKDPSEYRFELAQRQINEKNEYQQVAIYMHYENMIKKIIKYQQMLGYQIKYVDFYIIFAMMEKYYLFPDFLGIPLSQNDLRNYQDSMIKIQQSYIRSFNPQYQQDYEPYKTNLRITKEKYSEFQNIQYQELKKKLSQF
ncbi:hypothetical protein TTHERM_001076814 (macronuclear) [Tetrahymena thermophila SB210]|uniref:Uncharacterized protein n=1 Tax=Tetrahymena thermophila (strain SB210) TaxID=312017 RepID=W7XJH7_TETTS|nr:hypothetical protein TTHERM_001076814 [Tetrahymena thermophila SB210]EWS74169.1 hypothetical protein TTHERM_001076814 [Tetrahymena thermophila SB210]|eukprot:XP_012653290.1 hypothetical protein TTHERM_001076814 [Tetrahymena thermophila SB210]